MMQNQCKKSCDNDGGEGATGLKPFGSQDSAFVSHRSNRNDIFSSYNSVFSIVNPKPEPPPGVIIPSFSGGSSRDGQGGDPGSSKSEGRAKKGSESKKQYKVYSPELKM